MILQRRKEMKKNKSFLNYLLAAISALGAFVLIYLPLEYQITENWLMASEIKPIFGLSFLLVLVFLFGLIDWSRLLKRKLIRVIFLAFIVTCGVIYQKCRHEKLAREYLPKIYEISPDWGIQSVLVEIEGVNFLPAFRRGRIFLDGEEMIVRSWDEKLIVVEQQVPTKFGQFELYLIRADGMISNKRLFEIRDPDSLAVF